MQLILNEKKFHIHVYLHIYIEIYTAEDFYPKEEAVSKINAIKDWLRTVVVRDFEKVPLEAEQLDKVKLPKTSNI